MLKIKDLNGLKMLKIKGINKAKVSKIKHLRLFIVFT